MRKTNIQEGENEIKYLKVRKDELKEERVIEMTGIHD